MSYRILVVEDDDLKRSLVLDALEAAGYDTRGTGDGLAGMELIRDEEWDLVLLDLMLPGMDGLAILKEARALKPDLQFIMMTAHASVQTAVEAMKNGAHDYLTKPFAIDELLLKVHHLFEYRSKSAENVELRRALDSEHELQDLVFASKAMRALFDRLGRVAGSEATVLIRGETGTGKELVAEAIHRRSPRRKGPLVRVSCVSLSENIIESELFGHEKGAFSGAVRTRPGRFELAAAGSLFLDDVDDMPVSVQPKLLRVLQNRSFERVGGERTLQADVRVIAATKKDLSKLVAEGSFREDLYYRLSTVVLNLPPLRERREELPLLVRHFIAKYGGEERRFSAEALMVLRKHDWPGNVRELEHLVEAALILSHDVEIGPDQLPRDFLDKVAIRVAPSRIDLKGELSDVEREVIVKALDKHEGNVSKAARYLKIARSTLRDRIRKLNIESG